MSQSLSSTKGHCQKPAECLTPTTSSFLASSSAFLAQPADPNTPELIYVHFRRIRGAGATNTFRNQNLDRISDTRHVANFLELPQNTSSWWSKLWKEIKKWLMLLGVLALVVMLLYILYLRQGMAGLEIKDRRTVWVKEDLDDLLNGERSCRG